MSTAISIRLPERVAHELEQLCASTDRPKSYLIRKALETYLEEYADYQVALDRLHDKEDEVLSGAALRARLGL